VGNKNACPGQEQAFLGLRVGLKVPGLREAEPTATLGLCQVFITQE